ncbi:hypothetical protein HQ587_00890 [bacterium]|nr:hypothetical protein [bacterium]
MHSGFKHNITLLSIVVSTLCLILPSSTNRIRTDQAGNFPYFGESEIEFNECTTGVASGSATPDGRPLLWKNRDCGESRQEYHYVDDGQIPFIGLTYAEEIDKYFAGTNAAGFGIENSVAYNLDFEAGYEAGQIMKLALSTCRTVDDFEAMLDSTNDPGRLDCSNFGVIDSLGGATIFEAGRWNYTRFDADETEDGFLIRSNFALSGDEQPINDFIGLHRYEYASELWKHAAEQGELTPRFIYRNVVRNLSQPDFDPGPLPLQDYYDNNPFGCLPNDMSICRSSTRSVFIAQGVRDGDRPDIVVIWAMVGSPLSSIVTPLWVRAGSVPAEYDGDGNSRICEIAGDIQDWIYVMGDLGLTVDTWRLVNHNATGFWDFILPIEDMIFNRTERFLSSQDFNYDLLETFQEEVAQQAADSLEAWRPAFAVTENFTLDYNNNNLILLWDERGGELFRGESPRGYSVYRSSHPFREGDSGSRLGFTENRLFIDQDPPSNRAFYRVEAVY